MNSVCLIGNLCADPEMKQVGEQNVTKFRIAFNRGFGEKRKVGYIEVDSWGNLAKTCKDYLSKGKKVSVTGELCQDSWETDGKKMSKLFLTANSVDFLSPAEKAEVENAESTPGVKESNEEVIPF